MGGEEEEDEGVEEAADAGELGEAVEEEADGYLAGGERGEELGRVEVVVFEEVKVLVGGEGGAVLAEAVADFCHHEAFADGCDHLCYIQ